MGSSDEEGTNQGQQRQKNRKRQRYINPNSANAALPSPASVTHGLCRSARLTVIGLATKCCASFPARCAYEAHDGGRWFHQKDSRRLNRAGPPDGPRLTGRAPSPGCMGRNQKEYQQGAP
eukprot:762882-Hanusia_phi.AAC.5